MSHVSDSVLADVARAAGEPITSTPSPVNVLTVSLSSNGADVYVWAFGKNLRRCDFSVDYCVVGDRPEPDLLHPHLYTY